MEWLILFLIIDFKIYCLEYKVLTLHLHSIEDIQFITNPLLGGKGYENLEWNYPGDTSFDEEEGNKILDEMDEEEIKGL